VRATLYDSLGTLYVMGLYDEYEEAVAEVRDVLPALHFCNIMLRYCG
jgi:hypothetical protein